VNRNNNHSTQPANAKRPPHLTAEQMEAMLRPSPFRKQAGKHLESCTTCRDEVESLSELLGRFRATSVLYAEKAQGTGAVRAAAQPPRRVLALPAWRWSLAAGALACGLAAPPLLHLFVAHRTVVPQSAQSHPSSRSPISDEALLEGVQDDLATSVPAPLQSLAATPSSSSQSTSVPGASSRHQRAVVSHSR
jgi:hypothetical protein